MNLPKPKWALTPPKFRTRNSPDFLKLQFSENPKSDSKTQVPQANPRKHNTTKKNKKNQNKTESKSRLS